MKRLELTGNTYGRLTVVGLHSVDKESRWDCICDCGNTTTVRASHLKSGSTKSCGCLRVDSMRDVAYKGKDFGSSDYYRNSNLQRNYGITLEDYDDMLLDQKGVCAICGTDDPKGKGRFHVDHCHTTGKVRGLLCHHCNVGLGHFEDNIERLLDAIEYLRAGKFGGK